MAAGVTSLVTCRCLSTTHGSSQLLSAAAEHAGGGDGGNSWARATAYRSLGAGRVRPDFRVCGWWEEGRIKMGGGMCVEEISLAVES